MAENDDHLYIIYQGYAEQWRWRKVDAEGNTIYEDGTTTPNTDPNLTKNPIHSPVQFRDSQSAVEDLLKFDGDATYDVKRAANFDETIDDAEEREELEANQ